MHEKSEKYKNLAIFDFDGTLCKKDSFTSFIFYTFPKRHIVKHGIKILPWIIAYYAKIYPAYLMRPKLFYAMFKHTPINKINLIAKEYAQNLLEQQLDPLLYQQLKQHQRLGHDIVLVSASLDIYLQYITEYLNIDLICSRTEIKNQQYTGYYNSADCSHEQKKIRILEQYNISQYQHIYAYGNSDEDLAMLSLADFPYLTTAHKPLPALATIQMYA